MRYSRAWIVFNIAHKVNGVMGKNYRKRPVRKSLPFGQELYRAILPPKKKPRHKAGASVVLNVALIRRRLFLFSQGRLLRGFLVNDFHRQAHLATVVKAQKFNPDVLTFLQHIRRMVQAAVFDLADMHQTVAFAKEVHEGTEIDDLDNRAAIDLAPSSGSATMANGSCHRLSG